MKSPKNRLHSVMIVGATPAGVTAANKLGEIGIPVTLVDAGMDLNEKLNAELYRMESGVPFNYAHRPGLIRLIRNPGIRLIMPAAIDSVRHSQQGFTVRIEKAQTFVDASRCTLCGRCVEICPVMDAHNDAPIRINSRLSLPGRAFIDKRKTPLCQANCPLGVNVQGYMALAAAGRYDQALALIRAENVLPAICGRVCTHPCENACRRGEMDAPLAIRDIKRFLADARPETKAGRTQAPASSRSERIAVVGAGPAGLAAAADLVRQGFAVTLIEKECAGGGLLRYGIGPHRLPREILDRELETICAEGVQLTTGRQVRIPEDLPELKKDYHAIVLTVGSWADRRLAVAGEDLEGVEGCLSFLVRVHRGEIPSFSGKAAVIGDGNAAFDMARTLRRLGADVTVISWFDRGAIPADPHEVQGALDEGVRVFDNHQAIAFEGKNGLLAAVRLKPTQPGPPDEKGIAWPRMVPKRRAISLAFDHAFVAIGQKGAHPPTAAIEGLAITALGYIEVDDSGRTSMPGVYAAGDAVTGASSVVTAMAHGRKIAAGVISDLNTGKKPVPALRPERPESRDYLPLPTDQRPVDRAPMPELPVTERAGNFREVALGYDELPARAEAARCLQCGGCAQCLECLSACGHNGAVRHDEPKETMTENTGVLIVADPALLPAISGEDVIRAYGPPSARTDVHAMTVRGVAAVFGAISLLKGSASRFKGHGFAFEAPDTGLSEQVRMGVFACRCNDAFGWSEEINDYMAHLTRLPDIAHTQVLPSACNPEGIAGILNAVREKALTRVVLASCVCCPLNYVCSACTDQRSRLKQGLFRGTGISRAMVQTCNMRGEVLRMMEKNPPLAVDLFKGLMDRSIGRARKLLPFPVPARTYHFTIAVIGQTEAAACSALSLARIGFEVLMFGTIRHPLASSPEHPKIHGFTGSAATAVSGALGNFQIRVATGDMERVFSVGSVILGEKSRTIALYHSHRDLPGTTVQSAMQRDQVLGLPFMSPGTTSIAGLFLADPPGIRISKRTKGTAAAVLSAAAMPKGPRQFRGFSVVVDKARCRGCGRCLRACPYQAIALTSNALGGYTAVVDNILCKGCGNCISVCPSNAADSPFRDHAYLEQTLEELLVGGRANLF